MARRSKVDKLPASLKRELEKILLDKNHEGYKALAEWLRSLGYEISHASIHRYDQKLQRVMEKIKASTEAAKLIVSSNPDRTDEHSAAVIRMVQSKLFEAMLAMTDAEENVDISERIKLLSSAARAIAEASRASIAQKKFEQEVKERLEKAEKEAKVQGRKLDIETLEYIKQVLYGM
ncbi:MAG: DUF3486 family protein [Fervidobacterium sp.]|nr:DUF3486 family protein [Fervidobacterium sp.]